MLDLTMQAIQASLDGLAARQRISAQNLANSETPGYTAQTVNFEDSLSAALASGDPTRTTISTGVTADAPNITGIADTISPAAILSLGIPIGRIGSNPSTPAVWADLLMERLER